MKKYNYLLLLLSFLMLRIFPANCQELNYTQNFNSLLNLNPAYTGLTQGLKARFLFRDQWPKLPIDFKSYYFSADIGDRSLPGAGGIGLVVQSDNPGFGLINTLSLGLTVSVRQRIGSFSAIQVGIKAAMLQKKINWNDLTFSDQLDKRFGSVYQTDFIDPNSGKRIAPDFGAGGIIHFAASEDVVSGNIGLGVDHLFQPDVSFYSNENSKVFRKWTAHGDVRFTLDQGNKKPMKLEIGGIYQKQDDFSSMQLGLNGVVQNFYLGAWYKSTLSGISPNTVIALTGGFKYEFAEDMSIKFMYSYDIQVSGALMGTGGAHEISLILDLSSISLFGNGGGGRGRGYHLPNRGYSNISPLECSEF